MEKDDYVKSIELYGEYYKNNRDALIELLEMFRENNKVVLWGAGLKGKAFVQIIDNECKYIDYIVDRDEKKQGELLITGHVVQGIEEIDEESIILIVNVKYYVSVCTSLINHGYDLKLSRIHI